MRFQELNNSLVNTRVMKAFRVLRGYSLQDMANMLEVGSTSTVRNWECGLIEPNISNANRIAEILEVPFHKLFNIKMT